MTSIGIGITTYNRPQLLLQTVDMLYQNSQKQSKVVIINDGTESEFANYIKKMGFTFIQHQERLGIAKSKNHCLDLLRDCDYVFLFDDDCYPIQEGWEWLHINASKLTNIHHFNFLDHQINVFCKKHYINNIAIEEFVGLSGVCLFLTKEVLNKVGGFDANYDYYGYEHIGYSYRIAKAELTKPFKHSKISVTGVDKYLFSVDFERWKNGHVNFPGLEKEKTTKENHEIFLKELEGPIFKEIVW